MSEANGKVCCNCRHNIRHRDEEGMCHCECEVIDKYTEETTIIKGIETEDGEKLHAKLDEEKNLLIPIPVTYSGKTDVLYMQIPRNIFLEMIKGGE